MLALEPFDRLLDGKDGDLAMAGNFSAQSAADRPAMGTFSKARSKAGSIPTTCAATTRASGIRHLGWAGSMLAMVAIQPFASMIVPRTTSRSNSSRIETTVIMRKVIRRGSFTSVADLQGKPVQFIKYFNEVFAKPFRWTFTGRPLQA